MPDVWTTNPEKLRRALTELGASCGGEARVLKPRDAEWTCYLDPLPTRYDVYIHPWQDFFQHPNFLAPVVISLVGGIFIGLLWGRWFWRAKEGPRGST